MRFVYKLEIPDFELYVHDKFSQGSKNIFFCWIGSICIYLKTVSIIASPGEYQWLFKRTLKNKFFIQV